MRKIMLLLVVLPIGFFFFSCSDTIEEIYHVNEPEYMSYEDLRSAITLKGAQTISQPGKIYFKEDFIFINEYLKGIHIINNADPSQPQKVAFINIPGNVDMAVKGNMLYADSYIDLVTIDISDISNVVEVDRDENVFPYIIPGITEGIISEINESKGVIVGYSLRTETAKVKRDELLYGRFPMWESTFFTADALSSDKVSNNGTGTGGSMARFTLYDNFLYAIDKASLHLFDVSLNSNPSLTKKIPISWQIETLFPYNKNLFIGAQSGMFVYSLQNPANPEFISEFRHATACDPVVVEGNYAYVTLRGGNLCGAIESQLNVIDISTLEYPEMLESYAMKEPYGLGIDSGVLFICDGDDGLKVYDANDPYTIDEHLLAHYPNINAFDVIPLGDVLLMIGGDGLYQYDYSSLDDIKLLSHIAIN